MARDSRIELVPNSLDIKGMIERAVGRPARAPVYSRRHIDFAIECVEKTSTYDFHETKATICRKARADL